MTSGKLYILTTDGETPVEINNLETWLRWVADPKNMRVMRTELRDTTVVSTVFLAGNIGSNATKALEQGGTQPPTVLPDGRPLLWETSVIWARGQGQPPPFMARTPTRKDAIEAHRLACAHASVTLAHRLAQPIPVEGASEPAGLYSAIQSIVHSEAHPEIPASERHRMILGIANKALVDTN